MNLNKLNTLLQLRKQLDELNDRRTALYYNVSSPTITGGVKSSEPSDPTAKTVSMIVALDEKIRELNQQYTSLTVEVLEWLYKEETTAGMKNPSQFRSVIICRFILGKTWDYTARYVMRHPLLETISKQLYRYFRDHPEG